VQILVVDEHDGSRVELCRIRKKLGSKLVRTVRGEGYALSE
jgi:DNA-binding response OmpR family regulator